MALYYPYVHPRKEEWIKQAALFWRHIYRIVPENYPLFDTPTLARLADAEVLLSLPPGDPAMAGLADAFIRFVTENQAALADAYNLDTVSSLPERQSWPHDAHLNPRLGWIHAAKLDQRVQEAVVASGLAVRMGDWFGMHPKLADVYVCALAGDLSRRGGTTPITDGELEHVGAYGWEFDNIAQGLLPGVQLPVGDQEQEQPEAAERLFLTIAMKSLRPRNLKDVSVEQILELRAEHESDFWNYRERVEELVTGLVKFDEVTDHRTLARHVESEYQKKLGKDLRDLRTILKAKKLDAADMTIAVTQQAPLITDSVAHFDPTVFGAAAGAAAIGVLSTLRSRRGGRKAAMAVSPATWLIRVEQLQPAGLAQSIARRVKTFLR